jgi:hypothetical protein
MQYRFFGFGSLTTGFYPTGLNNGLVFLSPNAAYGVLTAVSLAFILLVTGAGVNNWSQVESGSTVFEMGPINARISVSGYSQQGFYAACNGKASGNITQHHISYILLPYFVLTYRSLCAEIC